MKTQPKKVMYRVVSGDPISYTSWEPRATLAHAREAKKEMEKSNPHQGGGYHIVKVETTFKVIK